MLYHPYVPSTMSLGAMFMDISSWNNSLAA